MLNFDHHRKARIGLPESVYCENKTVNMLNQIVADLSQTAGTPVLFTRLAEEKYAALDDDQAAKLDYDTQSGTANLNGTHPLQDIGKVAIITAGTSDLAVARETHRTLEHLGVEATLIPDVGVAGLWRLQERLKEINSHQVVITVAGMDAALVSVMGGLTSRPVIGVPTSVGYGVSRGGETALNSMLTSCSSGIVVVNIDNGYGAACAAVRMLHGMSLEQK